MCNLEKNKYNKKEELCDNFPNEQKKHRYILHIYITFGLHSTADFV